MKRAALVDNSALLSVARRVDELDVSGHTLTLTNFTVCEVKRGFLDRDPAPETIEKAQFLCNCAWLLLPTFPSLLKGEMEEDMYSIWGHEPADDKNRQLADLRLCCDGKAKGLGKNHDQFYQQAKEQHRRFFEEVSQEESYKGTTLEEALRPDSVHAVAIDVIAEQVAKLGFDADTEQHLVVAERVARLPLRSPAWAGLIRLVIWSNWHVQHFGRIKSGLYFDAAWLRHSLMVDKVMTCDKNARRLGTLLYPEVDYPEVPTP